MSVNIAKIRTILSSILFVLTFGFSAMAAEQVFFYHTDPAGTPLAMTNSSGSVVWKTDYKPFGEENSITGAAANDRRFVGKEKDEETGLSYFGARYEDAKIGRFIAIDPVGAVDPKTSTTNEKQLLEPQRLNAYAYGLNNPYRYVDPDGRDVTIIITRDRYTKATVTGTIRVSSNVINSTFNGNTLENARAGDNHNKPPIPPGTYDAHVRADHNPNRVELQDVPGYANIQIHTGNTADNVKGCFAVGTTRSNDFVGGSKNAMANINEVIRKDGTGNISVIVSGASTQ